MKRIWINPDTPLFSSRFLTTQAHSDSHYPIRTVPLTKNVVLEFPLQTPPWQIHQAALFTLAKFVLDGARSRLYVSGTVAASLYGANAWKLDNQITFISVEESNRKSRRLGIYCGTSPLFTENADSFAQPTLVRRKYRPFPAEAFVQKQGMATLSAPFLVLDLLSENDPFQAICLADQVVKNHLKTSKFQRADSDMRVQKFKAHLLELAELFPLPRSLKRAVRRISLIDPFADSVIESVTRVTLNQLRVTNIFSQAEFHYDSKRFFVDFYLPDLRVILEVDGSGKYTGAADILLEKEREAYFSKSGFRVVRVSYLEVSSAEFPFILAKKLNLTPGKLQAI